MSLHGYAGHIECLFLHNVLYAFTVLYSGGAQCIEIHYGPTESDVDLSWAAVGHVQSNP